MSISLTFWHMNSTEYKAKKKRFHNSCDKQYYNSKHFHHIQNNKKNHKAYLYLYSGN